MRQLNNNEIHEISGGINSKLVITAVLLTYGAAVMGCIYLMRQWIKSLPPCGCNAVPESSQDDNVVSSS